LTAEISRIEKRLVSSEDDNMLYPQKWMRRRTFDHLCAKLDKYENTLDELSSTRLLAALGRVLAKSGWTTEFGLNIRPRGSCDWRT
jgi:hypothetical protein